MVDECKKTGFPGYIWELVYTNLNVFDSMSKTNTGTEQTTFHHKKSRCVLSSSPSYMIMTIGNLWETEPVFFKGVDQPCSWSIWAAEAEPDILKQKERKKEDSDKNSNICVSKEVRVV